jgi:hypothetical protein
MLSLAVTPIKQTAEMWALATLGGDNALAALSHLRTAHSYAYTATDSHYISGNAVNNSHKQLVTQRRNTPETKSGTTRAGYSQMGLRPAFRS